ncbi:PD-(D/E)XK nuclease family protein [Enterovirga sp. GCM10030262]|uniref:PDDEXK-like family protein n=1 Tax=Enterovirga sp. GCM10030262 TaxID=3273391 RepID=UPI0036119A2C
MGSDAAKLLDEVATLRVARERADAFHAVNHAPAFNAADDIYRPGETTLSRAFCWLLDDCGTHGQGGRFRQAFFEHVLRDQREHLLGDWTGAVTRCEVPTICSTGRIDLLFDRLDGFSIVIENKPWAGWQARQLGRYWEDLGRRDRRGIVVALVGGAADASASVKEHWRQHAGNDACPNEIVGVGYHEVVSWLEACAQIARPEKVRSTLFDLAAYCRRTILSEGMPMSQKGDLIDAICDAGGRSIGAALDIEAAMNDVREVMAQRLAFSTAWPENWSINPGIEKGGGYHGIGITPWRGTKLTFALFGKAGCEAWVGILEKDAKDICTEALPEQPWIDPNFRWWRYLDSAEMGEEPDRLWALPFDTLRPRLVSIAEQVMSGLRQA